MAKLLSAGEVHGTPQGLVAGGATLARRRDILAASVLARRGETLVRLAVRGAAPIEISVASRTEGKDLLRAMELDERRFASRYRARSRGGRAPIVAAVVLVAALTPFLPWAISAGAAAALVLFAGLRERVDLLLGADGVGVLAPLRPSRLIPYATMKLARRDVTRVRFRARNGTELAVEAADEDEAAAIVEDVNDRIALVREAERSAAASALRRAGRPVAAWLRDLRTTTAPEGAYRSAAPPPETLWRVLEDGAAMPTARAAAAVALRARIGGDDWKRVARVIEACAAPELRGALERIVTSVDDDEIARALEPLEDEADDGALQDQR